MKASKLRKETDGIYRTKDGRFEVRLERYQGASGKYTVRDTAGEFKTVRARTLADAAETVRDMHAALPTDDTLNRVGTWIGVNFPVEAR